jgi:uncharacterized protein (DUF1501 family)
MTRCVNSGSYAFLAVGSLAFVQAAGSPDPTRSHFDGQDHIESGTPGNKATPDGWSNRLEGAMPTTEEIRSAPTRAVSIGSLLPRMFKGRNRVATIASGATAARPTILDRPNVRSAFKAIYRDDARTGSMFANYVAARTDVVAAIEQADPEMIAVNNGAPSTYAFASDAACLGALMRRDPRVQLGFPCRQWMGYARESGWHKRSARRLAFAFRKGNICASPQSQPRIRVDDDCGDLGVRPDRGANGNAGTDHGHGNLMWLMGGPIGGGKVHGEWLDDTALYEGRDLAVVTDYRTVLAQMCERHLRLSDTDLSAIFPNMPRQAKSIQLVKA